MSSKVSQSSWRDGRLTDGEHQIGSRYRTRICGANRTLLYQKTLFGGNGSPAMGITVLRIGATPWFLLLLDGRKGLSLHLARSSNHDSPKVRVVTGTVWPS